ncbi:unnamed protein product [Heligmosomoides polygyrus]|uniref:Bestrophin homolog n=1 Tax=Heligmosomoides polygyrus TaxID=6339 RepID=A0A183GHM9_HELPZ|nr:unnamed protein product [Heligmosomoides polygyrus]
MMTEEQQTKFIKYVVLFDSWTKEIPLTFLLGFYVAMIIRRWWDCCQLISWPDHLLYNVSALIRGNDPETRIIRKTIARYAILSSVLAYPTDEHLLDSGLITKEELDLFKTIHVRVDPHQKWFVPINWIQTMMVRCFEKGTLGHTNELRVLLDALEKYRNGFFQLFIYDWIAIPLVYTQLETYRRRFARLFLYDWISIPLVYTQGTQVSNYDSEKAYDSKRRPEQINYLP